MKKIIVTGSSGLIGSEVCRYFAATNLEVIGVDNNSRKIFFGEQGDTTWNRNRLINDLNNFRHEEVDIRNREAVLKLIERERPDAVVHAAAQPSHDKAAQIPFEDFDTNAGGTFNLLEACRRNCPESPFVFMSTNKVYGDKPNTLQLTESATRYDYADADYAGGIAEDFGIDQSKHSLFGASKVAADVAVQEYGRYFGMPTCCLRGGCLTGPNHSGVQLHGFLSYLIKCNLEGTEYSVFGYKGKQVRDNIHSLDVARFIDAFIQSPRSGEVYNIGGGKANACSILEAFELVERFSGKAQEYTYVDQARIGDHICYYSDLSKMKAHYPKWDISVSLEDIFEQIVLSWIERKSKEKAEAA